MASTIIDVAKLSGYSKATVSRAFASPEQVSAETREKIYAAAKALSYTPNMIARAMVKKSTESIGFIIHQKQSPVILNPFYSPILEAILEEGMKRAYSLFISTDQDLCLPSGEIYTKRPVDGVILAGQVDMQLLLSYQRQQLPLVLLNRQLEMENVPCVTADHFGGAVQAVDYLYQKGHRKIGLLAGRFSPQIASARYNGYVHVLKQYGLSIDLRFVQEIDATTEEAEAYIHSILALEDRPSAFFCTNDSIAIGAIKAVLRAGKRVPEDLAIVGFDDSEISRVIEPELTTVHIQKQRMGKLAAQRLFALLDGESFSESCIETPTQLVIRASA